MYHCSIYVKKFILSFIKNTRHLREINNIIQSSINSLSPISFNYSKRIDLVYLIFLSKLGM